MAGMMIEEFDKMHPQTSLEHNGTQITDCILNPQTLWRGHGWKSKESNNLEWISGSNSDDVLFDIGPNVKMYAVWAAMMTGVSVCAFKPEAQNYALLSTNIIPQ